MKFDQKALDQMVQKILSGPGNSVLGEGQPTDRLQRFREASLKRKSLPPVVKGVKWTGYSK